MTLSAASVQCNLASREALKEHPSFEGGVLMQRTLLTLALIATASVSYAQQPMRAEPTDPYGRPLIGRNDWVRQPGDQPGPSGAGGAAMNANMATAPAPQMQMAPQMASPPMPAQTGPRQATFKDEFGFRYDAQGNRLDARGNIISPQTR
jgi:hypothetical protein